MLNTRPRTARATELECGGTVQKRIIHDLLDVLDVLDVLAASRVRRDLVPGKWLEPKWLRIYMHIYI